MPIYEYQCETCKDVIEAWQSLSDKPMTTCPECSGTLKKLISMSSFSLKGGGWYADGYSSKSTNSSKPCAKATESASKSDAKPAACPAKNASCNCG